MANELQFTVGADVSQATKAMDGLVKNVGKATEILTGQLERLQRMASLPNLSVKQYERIQSMMARTQGELNRVQTSFQKFGKGTADATNALGNFSRIAQDAPYGIMGIANNINPALESFQRLQKETGSTGAALKAMAAGLTGPAGIGLAIGVVSSLLVAFGDKLFGAGEKAKYLGDDLRSLASEADATKKAIEGLADTVNFLNRASAIDIRLKGGSDIDVINRQIERLKFNIQEVEQYTVPQLEQALADLSRREASAPVGSDEAAQIQESLKKTGDALNAARKQQSDFRKDIIFLEGDKNLAIKKLNEDALKDLKDRNKKEAAERARALKEYEALMEKYRRIAAQAMLDMRKLDIAPVPVIKDDSKLAIEQYLSGLRREFERQAANSGISAIDLQIGETQFKQEQQFLAQLEQRAVNIANVITSTVTPAFQEMFDAIFDGKNAIQGFFQGLANGLKQLLSRMAAALIQAIALKAIFSAFGLAEGSQSIGKLFKGLMGFAEGGVVFGPTAALIGEGRGTSRSNPEIVAPLDKLKDFIGGGVGRFPDYLPVMQMTNEGLLMFYENALRQHGRIR